MTNETTECVKECPEYPEPRVHKIGETVKFMLDNYGTLYPYNENDGVYFREGYKMVECEITNIADIKLVLDYPVRNIYEEQVLPDNYA